MYRKDDKVSREADQEKDPGHVAGSKLVRNMADPVR